MTRVLITGSADGLGRAAARTLLADGHDVIVHARNAQRAKSLDDLTGQGAEIVVGDLSSIPDVRQIAAQLDAAEPVDAVIHNAGVYTGRGVMPVNIIAPYLLTALLHTPTRHVYLSSGAHLSGHPDLDGTDWQGQHTAGSYADSKLHLTALAFAVARLRPGTLAHAVNPGWVPTKMGGPNATDDLEAGHLTQTWLATSTDPDALTSGDYWFHRTRQQPHPATRDAAFQDALLAALATHTGTPLLP
jgi:NAD(P)-dependent dehydrogenase (short-subunit alcohol dehydrogenase family)